MGPILPRVSTPPFLDLPPGVTRALVETERGRFATLRGGEPADDVAVLVPGFTGSKEDFIAVLEPLATAGFAVVSIDLAGQFESPASATPYSLEGFAADLLSVVDAVSGAPVHVVGHSFGGLVAREAVLADPLGFASLTLMASGPAALPEAWVQRLRLFATVIADQGPEVAWAARRALEAQEGVLPPDDPEIDAFLTRRFLSSDPACLIAMIDILAEEPDRVAALAAVAPRAQVVFGVDDDTWPTETQRWMAQRLQADVVAVEGAGHSPQVDHPQTVAAALTTFWRR